VGLPDWGEERVGRAYHKTPGVSDAIRQAHQAIAYYIRRGVLQYHEILLSLALAYFLQLSATKKEKVDSTNSTAMAFLASNI
jgi:hypothetical protein